MNKHMWEREPLNIVRKGVIRSGNGLDKPVEQLLLNGCIKFTFDTGVVTRCIWF